MKYIINLSIWSPFFHAYMFFVRTEVFDSWGEQLRASLEKIKF